MFVSIFRNQRSQEAFWRSLDLAVEVSREYKLLLGMEQNTRTEFDKVMRGDKTFDDIIIHVKYIRVS